MPCGPRRILKREGRAALVLDDGSGGLALDGGGVHGDDAGAVRLAGGDADLLHELGPQVGLLGSRVCAAHLARLHDGEGLRLLGGDDAGRLSDVAYQAHADGACALHEGGREVEAAALHQDAHGLARARQDRLDAVALRHSASRSSAM